MTDNTEKIEQLLKEARDARARVGASRLTSDSHYVGQSEYMIGIANAFSALAEATGIMAEDLKELHKKFGDLAE